MPPVANERLPTRLPYSADDDYLSSQLAARGPSPSPVPPCTPSPCPAVAPPQTLHSQRLIAPPVVPLAPRCPQRECCVPNRPGNIYGDDHYPVEQVRDSDHLRQWCDIVQEPSSSNRENEPELAPTMPGNLPSTPASPAPPALESDNEADVTQLCREGEVRLMVMVMSKAIPYRLDSAESKPLCEWTLRDIQTLTATAQEEWKATCQYKLDILHEHKVFEQVDTPKGHKVISCYFW